ncbi:MAG: glycosyltransferase [Eubacteriales bacterium]
MSVIKYSVLMSVYHKEKSNFLKQSIESIMQQSIRPDQFVIVKDGPLNEELDSIISCYQKENPDIFTILILEKNCGLANALNKGLLVCRNELVARMDSDDISIPERCKKQLKAFKENSNLVLIGSNMDEFYDNPNNIVTSRVVPDKLDTIKLFSRRRNPFNHPTVMYKKSRILECGGYNSELIRAQDFELFTKIIHSDGEVANIDESLLKFRSNADSYKRRKEWNHCKSHIKVVQINYKRRYCSVSDLLIVICGQVLIHFAPNSIMKWITAKFLRKKL